ncbi:MAG: polysaccharide biosynthesis/export family protein, partial [Paludibacteraceae bacterium]|nr:polysaccharide biosynthesis/export family protein [Paludibacteraceae bacterium]
ISSFSNYRIYDDGTIDLPFADHIKVSGLTLREAERAIEEALQPMIPDVMVKVAMVNDQFYFVGEGGVGAYSIYKERLNIFQALALVGDFKSNGDRKRVRIIRPNPDGNQPIVKEFDLRTSSIIDSEFYYIYPNDVIYLASIKGDFWKVQNYSSTISTLSTSINFLVTVINLGLSF